MRDAAVGDVTGDGILDVVIAAVDDRGWFLIQRGNGDGTFTYQGSVPVGSSSNVYTPWGVVIGDFNRDGKNDVAATAAGSLVVYLNPGQGYFSQPTFYPVSNSPVAKLAIGDVNHDGFLDAVITNNSSNSSSPNFVPTVSVLLGNGAGGFSAATNYQTGRGTSAVTLGDMNNDSNLDIVIANGYRSAFSDSRTGILYGNGTGGFSAPQRFVTGLNSFEVSLADFNADGRLDIAAPNYNGSNVGILLSTCLPDPPAAFPSVSISQDVTVTETDSGTIDANFTVSLSATSSRQVRVDYYSAAGTAAGTTDYRRVAGTLVFQPNEVSKSFTVAVNGDTTDEFNESFSINLANPLNVTLGNKSAAVNIIEDDDPAPGISVGDLAFNEGSGSNIRVEIPITLSQASGKPVSVTYATSAGTAVSGTDYFAAAGTLNIPAGNSTAVISIAIISDTLVEPDETFFVTIGNPVNTFLNRSQATATIVNDDIGGNVQFNNAVYSSAENSGSATITISRTNGSAGGIVVQYTTGDGTATAGQDYSTTAGSVTFGANETTKTFTVPVINDSRNEDPTESVNLVLSNVAGGASLGTPQTAVLNITDDDPLPAIRVNNFSLSEGNQGTTTATIAVNLLAASGRTVSVNYGTVNGTATAPEDYIAASGTVSFAPGETGKTISVQIVGDTNFEPDESFQISFSNPLNATLQNSVATVVITNDDSRRSFADFDGDGKADLGVFRPGSGSWYIQQSSAGFTGLAFGLGTDKLVPADYDGDGKTDFAVVRSGIWYLQRSSLGFTGIQFGAADDIPVPADYDGDGKADVAVFRPSNGTWYIQGSTAGFYGATFGTSTDKPVPADYDGDGKADIAVNRSGTWYIQRSQLGFYGIQFGDANDKLVPADYDGDGKTDVAVFRPSNGVWYLQQSTAGFTGITFGLGTDLPTPADYDGDGKTDVAVFRNGTWYLNRSTQGFTSVAFGAGTDKPIPNSFVP